MIEDSFYKGPEEWSEIQNRSSKHFIAPISIVFSFSSSLYGAI